MAQHTRIDLQIIKRNGKPLFAVIPYEEYLGLVSECGREGEALIPHEVVGMVIKHEIGLVKAWRQYLGLSQQQVAERAGLSRSTVSRIENSYSTPQGRVLDKLAAAMGILAKQLVD